MISHNHRQPNRQQTQQRGYRRIRENAIDAGVTYFTFGMVGAPLYQAGQPSLVNGVWRAGLTKTQQLWANLGGSAVTDGPQVGSCLASGQGGRGC